LAEAQGMDINAGEVQEEGCDFFIIQWRQNNPI